MMNFLTRETLRIALLISIVAFVVGGCSGSAPTDGEKTDPPEPPPSGVQLGD
jgi:hypothetical protein